MTAKSASVHPTSVVSADAELGAGVTVGPLCVIHANVVVEDRCFVDSHTILGAPTAAYYDDPDGYAPGACRIGAGAVIRSHSVIYSGVEIGRDFACGHHVTIREGSRIDEGVRVGSLSDLQGDLSIGRFTRLHSSVFVAQRSTVEEFVWLLPYVFLANDPHPPSDTCTVGPTIRRFAVVSAGATIFPAVEIGEGALVGAMALVRHDVPPHSVVVGIPGETRGSTADIACHDGQLDRVYPWWTHFRRGYPQGVLPAADATWDDI
jgi:acetyltransferase-like isoleucine patch superfamily enzyme